MYVVYGVDGMCAMHACLPRQFALCHRNGCGLWQGENLLRYTSSFPEQVSIHPIRSSNLPDVYGVLRVCRCASTGIDIFLLVGAKKIWFSWI